MLPDLPEIVLIGVISALMFGAGKLDDLGEWVWRLRCWWQPTLSDESPQESETPRGIDHSGGEQ